MRLTNPSLALGLFLLGSDFFQKLPSAGFPPYFVLWTHSFFFDRRACMVFQNHKIRFFQVRQSVPQGFVIDTVFSLFLSMIFLHLCPLR